MATTVAFAVAVAVAVVVVVVGRRPEPCEGSAAAPTMRGGALDPFAVAIALATLGRSPAGGRSATAALALSAVRWTLPAAPAEAVAVVIAGFSRPNR